MNTELSTFAARLRERIPLWAGVRNLASITPAPINSGPPHVGCYEDEFNELALELFALQFCFNPAYKKICAVRGLMPTSIRHWRQIPAVPTSAFKELELSCILPAERQEVFHSSGTTGQSPSRHFHHADSLAVYEASLWTWFARHFAAADEWLFLTPPRSEVPHSSLVYMFETVRRKLDLPASAFFGEVGSEGEWRSHFLAIVRQLQSAVASGHPVCLLGTAFSFVHLLDHLAVTETRFRLPAGSRVMETGGYKNRSRTMAKAELHELISDRLGLPRAEIICEYGMSELSSQAYSPAGCGGVSPPVLPNSSMRTETVRKPAAGDGCGTASLHGLSPVLSKFRFPPWARAQIVSPESGREVAEGEIGIIRIFDLANVFSVAAVQTEDLGIRRGNDFELIGRAAQAEARGCSLMIA